MKESVSSSRRDRADDSLNTLSLMTGKSHGPKRMEIYSDF